MSLVDNESREISLLYPYIFPMGIPGKENSLSQKILNCKNSSLKLEMKMNYGDNYHTRLMICQRNIFHFDTGDMGLNQ